MSFETVEETEAWDAVVNGLLPKQLKVVNFFVGQAMRAGCKNYDPAVVRRLIIQKLSIVTYEESQDGS